MSVERDRNGHGWIARWREHGRQRTRKFELKRDEAFEREVKRRQQLGPLALQQLTARGGPTLDQWIEQRWAPEHACTLEKSTRERYANIYKCHVWEALGDVPVGDITVAGVREWQASLLRAGVGAGSILKAPGISLERAAPRGRERGDPGQPPIAGASPASAAP